MHRKPVWYRDWAMPLRETKSKSSISSRVPVSKIMLHRYHHALQQPPRLHCASLCFAFSDSGISFWLVSTIKKIIHHHPCKTSMIWQIPNPAPKGTGMESTWSKSCSGLPMYYQNRLLMVTLIDHNDCRKVDFLDIPKDQFSTFNTCAAFGTITPKSATFIEESISYKIIRSRSIYNIDLGILPTHMHQSTKRLDLLSLLNIRYSLIPYYCFQRFLFCL